MNRKENNKSKNKDKIEIIVSLEDDNFDEFVQVFNGLLGTYQMIDDHLKKEEEKKKKTHVQPTKRKLF